MSIVIRPTLEGSAFVQDTLQAAYVDLALDQILPRGVQNDRLSQDLHMRNKSESTSEGYKAIMTGRRQ